MKTERELFEEYLFSTDKFKFRNKVFLFMLDENGEYEDIPVLEHWNTWQASIQREGYKLVPLELADEIEDKIWDNLSANHTITNQEGDGFIPVEDIDLGGIYKAMIRVIDNDH